MPRYVPDRGDVVWLDFTPQSGHEQAGKRPALVMSPRQYNTVTGLMVCCPITSRVKGYPFEVEVKGARSVTGVVLADQVKSLDWVARSAKYQAKADPGVVREVRAKLAVLI